MNTLAIIIISFYKKWISPLLPGSCRFTPTCSAYSAEAFQVYPFHKALYLAVHRILRCNPFSQGFEDPLPYPHKKD